MLIFVRLSKQRWRLTQERQESRGGGGYLLPPFNNRAYSPLLTWLKIYNGVLVYKWYNKLVKRKVWVTKLKTTWVVILIQVL